MYSFYDTLKHHPITQHKPLLMRLIETAEKSAKAEFKPAGLFGQAKVAAFVTPAEVYRQAHASNLPISMEEAEVYVYAVSRLVKYDMSQRGLFVDPQQKAVEHVKKYGSAILASDLDLKALFRQVYPNERTFWEDTAQHLV